MDISTVKKVTYTIKLENVSRTENKETFEILYNKNSTPRTGETGSLKDLSKDVRETIRRSFGAGFVSYQVSKVGPLSEGQNQGNGEIIVFPG